MNRRQLIKRIGQGVVGAGAVALGVKAAPVEMPAPIFGKEASRTLITVRLSDSAVAEAFERNYKNNHRIRQMIREDKA